MKQRTLATVAIAASLSTFSALLACNASPPEPAPQRNHGNEASQPSAEPRLQPSAAAPVAAPEPPAAPKRPAASLAADDPLKGQWTLDDATKGLPPGKQIVATIDTSLGKLVCKLYDDKAPITVANFVGLARGLRPWKTPAGTWEKKPAYDGTVFHRIIKGFMIQGGDAKKNGSGEAGYVIPDEIWAGAKHDRAGLLCMANRGANTNSAQFFITDDAANHLDKGYTIFGECGPVELVHKIASIEVRGDRPTTAPDIKSVTISRK